jgi:hypothetical protein
MDDDDDIDEPIKDDIATGLRNLVEGNKNPTFRIQRGFPEPSGPTTNETSNSRIGEREV